MRVALKRNRQLSVYGTDNFDLGSEIKYLWEGETSSKWSRFHFVLIKIVMFARSAQWSSVLHVCLAPVMRRTGQVATIVHWGQSQGHKYSNHGPRTMGYQVENLPPVTRAELISECQSICPPAVVKVIKSNNPDIPQYQTSLKYFLCHNSLDMGMSPGYP